MIFLLFLRNVLVGCATWLVIGACVSIPPLPETPTEKRVIGYTSSWSIYARGFEIAKASIKDLTHLHYAFAVIDENFHVSLMDPVADIQKILGPEPEGLSFHGNFAQLAGLKQRYPELKTLITVGGGGEQARRFSRLAADPDLRAAFVASVPAFLFQYGFDGIDIDWEYPAFSEQKNCTLLFKELRIALDAAASAGHKYLLSIAVGASEARLSALDFIAISPFVHYINLMAYDYHGPWDPHTGHQAPLNPDPLDPGVRAGWASGRYNIRAAVDFCIAHGLSREKIVVGVPLYGRSWFAADKTGDGRFATALKERPPGTWKTGNYDFSTIRELAQNGSGMMYHDINSQTTWYFDATTGLFISGDDSWSLRSKVQFVLDRKLGGIAFWEISSDREGEQVGLASDMLK